MFSVMFCLQMSQMSVNNCYITQSVVGDISGNRFPLYFLMGQCSGYFLQSERTWLFRCGCKTEHCRINYVVWESYGSGFGGLNSSRKYSMMLSFR